MNPGRLLMILTLGSSFAFQEGIDCRCITLTQKCDLFICQVADLVHVRNTLQLLSRTVFKATSSVRGFLFLLQNHVNQYKL